MPQCLLAIVRWGRQWGLAADGQVMAVTRTRRQAHDLARDTARTLLESGYDTTIDVPPERRSFKDD